MTKFLHKEIMKEARLRNKYLKSKSLTDRTNYNIPKKVTNDRTFWRTVFETYFFK